MKMNTCSRVGVLAISLISFILPVPISSACPSSAIKELGISVVYLENNSKVARKIMREYLNDPVSHLYGVDVSVASEIKVGGIECFEVVPNDLKQFYEMPASEFPCQAVVLYRDKRRGLRRVNWMPLPMVSAELHASPRALNSFNHLVRELSKAHDLGFRKICALTAVLLCHNDMLEFPTKLTFCQMGDPSNVKEGKHPSSPLIVKFSAVDRFRGSVHYEVSFSENMQVTSVIVRT